MANELEKKIRTWLRKQGYPLEMRAARAFRSTGWEPEPSDEREKGSRWEANQSVYYKSTQGKWREIDVEATIRAAYPKTKPWRAFEFIALVECKSNTSKPWIVFSNESTAGPSLFGIESLYANTIGRVFLEAFSLKAVFGDRYEFFKVGERTGYSVVRAFEEGNQDQAYGSVSSIVDAARSWCRFDANEHTVRCRIVFPIIVLSAPIFECYLDDNNHEQIAPRESMTLYADSRVPGQPYAVIELVEEHALPAYVAKLTDLHNALWTQEQEHIVHSFDLYEKRQLDAKLSKKHDRG